MKHQSLEQVIGFPTFVSNDRIEKIVNNSDNCMTRVIIYCTNGYQISIIQGTMSYGGDNDLFELTVLTNDGKMVDVNTEDDFDQTLVYLTADETSNWIIKIAHMEQCNL